MNNPMFSIIVPVYNTEKELERCVRSVTCQSFRDFELILVDDGSKDRSGTMCDAFSSEDSRIITIHQSNAGSSAARNAGIHKASGDYLLFLDSDDLWNNSNALKDLSQLLTENPVDVVCFGVEIYNEDGTFVKRRLPSPCPSDYHSKEQILQHLIYTNQYFSASYVKVISRSLFQTNDLYFVKGLLSGEDAAWSGRVMLACKSLAIYPEAFYKRIRRNEGAITASIGKKNILDVFQAIQEGVRAVKEQPDSPELKHLYLEFWAYQYAMLFGLSYRMHKDPEYSSILRKFKEYRWLLKYDHVKKVRAVRYLVATLGIRCSIVVLSYLYKVR